MQNRPTVTASDRLMMTVFFAGVIHALLILGVSFSPPPAPKISHSLEIALLQNHAEKAPEKADFYALDNQIGSGSSAEKAKPQTPQLAQPQPAPEAAKPSPKVSPAPPAKSAVTRKVLTPKQAPQAIQTQATAQPEPEAEKPHLTAASLSEQIAQLGAELSRIKEIRAKRPIIKYINSINAHKYKAAAYEKAWQDKVERIGNLNYPDEARRQKLSGSLILAVGIKKDGSVASIQVRRSSGHKVLDDAAIQIVRLAAPFSPFPEGLKDEADILVITRTWKFFIDASLATSS